MKTKLFRPGLCLGAGLALLLAGGCDTRTPDAAPTPPASTPADAALTCAQQPEGTNYAIYPQCADGTAVGDVMPYYDAASNTTYTYFLKDIWNDATTKRHPWYGFKTSNFYGYSDLAAGEQLSCSAPTCAPDFAIGTGSVTLRNGTYYAYYTGFNPNTGSCTNPKEGVMLATATGLGQPFTKSTSFGTLYAPAGQNFDSNDNFRDPFVYFDAGTGQYSLLVAARQSVSGVWRGIIARYTSTNLTSWTYQGRLYDGGSTNFFMMECPQLFKLGSTYYLLFSDMDSKNVYYRKSASLAGPWSAPAGNARFDGPGFYGAKVITDKFGDSYIQAWLHRRAGATDTGAWQWGGNLVTHKLYQLANGDLALTMPHTLKSYLEATTPAFTKSSQWGNVTNTIPNTESYQLVSTANNDVANVLYDPINRTRFKISATVSYTSAGKDFGFLLGACDGYNQFYSLRFVPGQNRFSLDFTNRTNLTSTTVATADVPFPLQPNTDYTVDIVQENSVVVVYLNNVAALTARIYKAPKTSWGVFVDNSTATFKNIVVKAP
ncbi:glycoside hydrolase family 32 protein [Hymenobacter convexus]|uniref:glycoside hydrolase family 32 protein n=1 Tax=Hymenobacter sp. CA1UV-4 TaxID=3063782 RepID=UPI00271232EE|nr:glycoside hydrolase family 32 protein [Hymenobacter sp. CA1UV-4]MDO7851474.1 glycoside hydrolase family 32 protein [Hymenobacter sp. CA1UV-4]